MPSVDLPVHGPQYADSTPGFLMRSVMFVTQVMRRRKVAFSHKRFDRGLSADAANPGDMRIFVTGFRPCSGSIGEADCQYGDHSNPQTGKTNRASAIHRQHPVLISEAAMASSTTNLLLHAATAPAGNVIDLCILSWAMATLHDQPEKFTLGCSRLQIEKAFVSFYFRSLA